MLSVEGETLVESDVPSRPACLSGQIVYNLLGAVVRVLYSCSCKSMTPSHALNAVDKGDVRSIKDEVVNKARFVGSLN